MLAYLLLLLFAVIVAESSEAWRRQRESSLTKDSEGKLQPRFPNGFDLLLIAGLTVFSGARYGVGTDYFTYATIYDRVDPADWASSLENSPQELGFTVIMLMTKSVLDGSRAIFWVAAGITVVLIIGILRRLDGSFTMAVFLYISLAPYLVALNLVRQGIAIAIVLYADRSFERSKIRFILLIGIASSIHASAIIFGIIYVLTRNLRPSLGLLAGISIFSTVFTSVFMRSSILRGFLYQLNERYDSYLDSEPAGIGTLINLAFMLVALAYLILATRKSEVNQHYQVLAMMTVPFLIAGLEFKLAVRLVPYFNIFMVFAIVEALRGKSNKEIHYLIVGVVSLLYYVAYLANYGGLLPYQTI